MGLERRPIAGFRRPRPGTSGSAGWVQVAVLAVLFALALGAAAILALDLYGAERLRQARGRFAERLGPLEHEAYRPPGDAVDVLAGLHHAAGALALSADENAALRDLGAPSGAWTAAQRRQAEDLVGRNEPTLAALHAGVPSGASWEKIWRGPDGPEGVGPLVTVLTAGRVVRVEARLALADGDFERAGRAIGTLGRAADALYREPYIVAALIAAALETLELEAAHAWIEDPRAGEAELARLERVLAEAPAEPPEWWIAAEAAYSQALLEAGDGGESAASSRPFGGRVLAWREDLARARGLELWLELAETAELPQAERRARLEARVAPVLSSALLLGVPTPEAFLLPNLSAALDKLQRARSVRRLARRALGLRRAALAAGAYPAAVDPGPDPFTGNPVVYARLADGSARLAVDAAEALEATEPAAGAARLAPLFTWRLPTPG